jgi:tetratricopeptide (TPR) repeat protein
LLHYALMSISPAHLSVFHDLRVRGSLGPTAVEAWVFIVVAAAIVAAYARRLPQVAIGFAWFVAGIVPVSGLVTLLYPALVADRYLYIPLLGAAVAAGAGLQRLGALSLPAPRWRLAIGAAVAVVLVLAGTTALRGRHWRDSVTLWERATLEAPRNQYVLNGLGWAYKSVGRDAEARRALLRSLEVNEASPQAHLNLAILALLREDFAAAERHALRAIEIDPDSATAYRYLGRILHQKGDDAAARRAAERALELNGFDEAALTLLAELRPDGAGLPASVD